MIELPRWIGIRAIHKPAVCRFRSFITALIRPMNFTTEYLKFLQLDTVLNSRFPTREHA